MSPRLALIYSDGSMGIVEPGTTLDEAWQEALAADRNENDPAHFTRIAMVKVEIVEIVDTPALGLAQAPAKIACPHCGDDLTQTKEKTKCA